MTDPRRPAWPSRAVPVWLASVVALALLATALVERPEGTRPTLHLFRAAVVLLDPWFWVSVRNSAATALAATVVSLFLGLAAARVVYRSEFALRRPLTSLLFATAAVPTLVTALGLEELIGPARLGAFLPTFRGHGRGLGVRWLALVWAEAARGVPIVALIAGQALRRIAPLWEDSGRALGASPGRVWRSLVRPLIRGALLRAGGVVFSLALLDPAAPRVLGLRRTIGFQLLDGIPPGGSARTGLVALFGLAIVVALVGASGGGGAALRGLEPSSRLRRPGWARSLGLLMVLMVAVALAWIPVAALAAHAQPQDSGPNAPSVARGLSSLKALMADPEVGAAALHSLALGGGVASLAWLLAVLRSSRGGAPTPLPTVWGSGAALLAVPCAVALASLPLAVSRWFPGKVGMGGRGGLAWLEPVTSPGVALTLVLALAWTPALAEALAQARRRWPAELSDAAAAVGSSPWRTRWRLAWPLMAPPVVAAWLMAAACAGCDATTALLLTPTDRFRPLGPTVLALWDRPGRAGSARALAVVLGVAVAAVSSAGLGSVDRQVEPSRR